MNRIFFIPGVGANEKVFSEIGELPYEKILVKWVPNEENESIESYAGKLIETYNIKKEDTIAGLSFGGVLAQEISKQLGNTETILISSFRDKNDLRFPIQLGLKMGLYKLAPKNFKRLEEIVAVIFNSATEKSKPLVKQMIQAIDYDLIFWSIAKIAEIPDNKYQDLKVKNIIGTKDRIVKKWTNTSSHVINEGTHLMVYDKSTDITKALNSCLKDAEAPVLA